jgi:hypothetical protein
MLLFGYEVSSRRLMLLKTWSQVVVPCQEFLETLWGGA